MVANGASTQRLLLRTQKPLPKGGCSYVSLALGAEHFGKLAESQWMPGSIRSISPNADFGTPRALCGAAPLALSSA